MNELSSCPNALGRNIILAIPIPHLYSSLTTMQYILSLQPTTTVVDNEEHIAVRDLLHLLQKCHFGVKQLIYRNNITILPWWE